MINGDNLTAQQSGQTAKNRRIWQLPPFGRFVYVRVWFKGELNDKWGQPDSATKRPNSKEPPNMAIAAFWPIRICTCLV